MCILFLYGKSNQVDSNVLDSAAKTVNKFNSEIESYNNSPKAKMNTEFYAADIFRENCRSEPMSNKPFKRSE